MNLRKSQKLELIGGFLAFVALLIQVFLFTIFEHDAKEADDAVLKEQLTQIYYASLGRPLHNPKWEEIEDFYKGPKVKGDSHFQFVEVRDTVQSVTLVLFAVGGFVGFLGKYYEYREHNDAG